MNKVDQGKASDRLGRWAQRELQTLCNPNPGISDPDIDCTRPETDHHGWDFLLEWLSDSQGRRDAANPSRRACYVQVKGAGPNSTQVALNPETFRHMVHEPRPAFVIVLRPWPSESKKPGVAKLWLIHVDKDVIAAVLGNVWRRSAGQRVADKVHLSIASGTPLDAPSPRTLREALEAVVHCDVASYMEQKVRWVLEAGRGAVRFRGTITWDLPGDTEAQLQALIEFELGMRTGLPAKHLRMIEERFGVQKETVDHAGDLEIRATRYPQHRAKVRIIPSRRLLPAVTLNGEARVSFLFSGLNERGAPRGFRFWNQHFEVVCLDGRPIAVKVKPLDPRAALSVDEGASLAQAIQLLNPVVSESVTFQLFLEGCEAPLESGSCTLDHGESPFPEEVLEAWAGVRALTGLAGISSSHMIPWLHVARQQVAIRILYGLARPRGRLSMQLEAGAARRGEQVCCANVANLEFGNQVLVMSYALVGKARVKPGAVMIEPAEIVALEFSVDASANWSAERYLEIVRDFLDVQRDRYPRSKIIVQPEVHTMLSEVEEID